MRVVCLTVLFLLGSAAADCNFGPRIYENKIKDAIYGLAEKLRNEGLPALNLTSVDPLVLDQLKIQTNRPGLAELDWTMDNGQITGVTQFNITDIKFNIAGFTFKFAFLWPDISGLGDYVMDGLFGGVLPVFGDGKFDVTASSLKVWGDGKLGTDSEQHLRLDRFSIFVSLGEFSAKFTGLLGDEPLSALISAMVSESLPAALDFYAPALNNTVSPLVQQFANDFLKDKTIGDIIGGLGYSC